MNRVLFAALAGWAIILAIADTASAQTAVVPIGNAYAGATAGIIIPEDLDATFSGAVAGTGHLSFSAGPAITGIVGYHFNNYLAVEGELGFATFDENNFSGTLNGTTVSASIDGHVNTLVGFGNAIVTPLGRSRFTPYLGGGIGFVNFDERVNTIGGVTVDSNSSETDLAANFIAGLDFAITDRVSVGGRYRFIWANTSSTTTSGGVTTSQGDFTAHLLTVTGTFHF